MHPIQILYLFFSDQNRERVRKQALKTVRYMLELELYKLFRVVVSHTPHAHTAYTQHTCITVNSKIELE